MNDSFWGIISMLLGVIVLVVTIYVSETSYVRGTIKIYSSYCNSKNMEYVDVLKSCVNKDKTVIEKIEWMKEDGK